VNPTALPWWRRPVLADGAIAVLLLATSAPLPAREGQPLLVPVLLALILPLAVRRRYPVAVFVMVSVAALAQWLLTTKVGVYDFAFLVALYSVAAHTPRRMSLPAAGIGLLGSLLAQLQAYEQRGTRFLGVITPITVVTAVWLVGHGLRGRRQHLAEVEERAVRLERERDALARAAVAEERARIAREMHDVVAHSVAVMIAQSEGASVAIHTAPEQAERALEVISQCGRTALAELRRMLNVLRETSDVATTVPQPGLAQLEPLVTAIRASGLPVRFTREGLQTPVDPTLALAVYRIVQEALTNVLRHSGPDTATQLTCRRTPDAIEVEIVDAGRPGGAPRAHAIGPGHGLTGMRERVALFGGTFAAGPTPTGGWQVRALLPAS